MITLDEVDSTNAEIARMVSRGDAYDGLVVRALHQTQGRGRAGRSFLDDGGSLLVSSYHQLTGEGLGWVSFASAVAMVDALSGLQVDLKWPNDLQVDGLKLGGVLGEILDDGVVVGIGINLTSSPLETATHVSAHGLDIDADDLIATYLDRLAIYLDLVASGTTTPLRDRVRDLCVTLGTEVKLANVAGETFSGWALDIDHDGSLLVETDHGIERFAGVDVIGGHQ